MNYKKILLSIYTEAKKDTSYKNEINSEYLKKIKILSEKCFTQKGVYTVFITLLIYKIEHPEQDIRNHQTQIKNGFSGRAIDTKFITPTLKELGLPSMAESGWLTRSLEQPYPYTINYEGKISSKIVKKSFLELLDAIENNLLNPKYALIELFTNIINIQKNNIVIIKPLSNPEKLIISDLINILTIQFTKKYDTFGGSKLPVIAFYAIYKIILTEISRYDNCTLKPLGSHTTSDRTSKSSGDIEVYYDNKLFESIEIKLDKPINSNTLRIAKEKIIKFNPKRYYILSFVGIKKDEKQEIEKIINDIKVIHGCQVVINGVIPTLKYYFRLISNIGDFVDSYSNLIQNDLELKLIHKQTWNTLISELENEC
jgi:DNA (cytosine-5)-methyltransferase 1